jgi:hypothetical protein
MSANDFLTIVSGLPRSGTSMMMSMLAAGGLSVVQDGIRTADEDNPKGYYELEKIKKLKDDATWLRDSQGQVLKAISQLLFDLPTDGSLRYKIIFMRRNIDEVLASQKKMLIRRGTYKPDVKDEDIRRMFMVHLDQIADYLRKHSCFDVLYVNYNLMLENPADKVDAINHFLGGKLDTQAMAKVIDADLYRNRAGKD